MPDLQPNELMASLAAKTLNIPLIYSNGIGIAATFTEIQINLMLNNQVNYILALPIPVAKLLLENLSAALKEYQERTGIDIPSLSSIGSTVRANNPTHAEQ